MIISMMCKMCHIEGLKIFTEMVTFTYAHYCGDSIALLLNSLCATVIFDALKFDVQYIYVVFTTIIIDIHFSSSENQNSKCLIILIKLPSLEQSPRCVAL